VRARVASAVRPLALDAESLPAPRVQSTEEGQGLVEVNINALPWAHVRVDGRELGTTPLGAVGLDVGLREFELRFPGGRSVTYAVEIDPTVLYLSFGADRAPIVTADSGTCERARCRRAASGSISSVVVTERPFPLLAGLGMLEHDDPH
jgi:hypothetical protein